MVGGLAAFAVLLPAFLLVERRVRDPLMDIRLFEDRSFSWGLSASFLNAIGEENLFRAFVQHVDDNLASATEYAMTP